jgi:hypothetical protein
MNCPIRTQENADWLLDYSAGKMDRERVALLEQHLEICAECTKFVEAQRVVWSALSGWQPQPVSDDFDRRLYSVIDQAKPASWIGRLIRPIRPLFWRPMVPIAAACLVIVAGFLLHTPRAPVAPADSQARVEEAEPEQVETTLDDMLMLRELTVARAPEKRDSKSM